MLQGGSQKNDAARLMRPGLYPGDPMPSNVSNIVPDPWIRRSFDLAGIQLRVLVVDDNHNAAEALAAYLSFESMECRMAFGGLEAIKIGTDWAPHVIVMDISMPGCNGYEATSALRQDRRTSETIILAFTALNDDAEVRRYLADHSFDGYYQKGLPPSQLVTLLTSFAQ
jgi:two-component system, OmpR family, response regulator